eukprot:CAMPEP_0196668264 /NCGR_PEP_ID=MMETSP1086-20130531/65529_1 /TAXON_ID=77921 /ORGANISM="Cyanoptyche  gloeocystis , Strain SAG4.97" /LENGTH=151 /DNA_ID=CAMNT_0042005659 /DNA_START=511 /DNA_END=966 /DNA_ORIENTATION=+
MGALDAALVVVVLLVGPSVAALRAHVHGIAWTRQQHIVPGSDAEKGGCVGAEEGGGEQKEDDEREQHELHQIHHRPQPTPPPFPNPVLVLEDNGGGEQDDDASDGEEVEDVEEGVYVDIKVGKEEARVDGGYEPRVEGEVDAELGEERVRH